MAGSTGGGLFNYRHRPDLKISESVDERTRKTQTFVKSPATGEVLLLGPQEYALFQALDGGTTFAAVDEAFRARFGIGIARRDFDAFVQYLVAAGMLEPLRSERVDPGPTPEMAPAESEEVLSANFVEEQKEGVFPKTLRNRNDGGKN